MNKLYGANKSLVEQIEILKTIIYKNDKLRLVLDELSKSNLENYYVAAGCINQTVFNYYHDYDMSYGIKDIDIVYYDSDISSSKENDVINNIKGLLSNIDVEVDIVNEARVHLWYKQEFGYDIEQYKSVEHAISKWGATITCIGVKIKNNELIVYAPYGLDDIFNGVIRPVKDNFDKNRYYVRANKWISKWPNLTLIPWNDEE